jgi:spermidine/putrescine transport system permease protein
MAALVPPAASTGVEQPVVSRRRNLTPYLLLAPGLLWLLVFFLIPTLTLAQTSLQEGSLQEGYQFTWRFANYVEAVRSYSPQFIRSLWYASLCTVLCLLIGYPLAYFIALRSGRFKSLMLLLVVMPLLVSFLVRTLAWRIILADQGWVVNALQEIGVLAPNGRLLATGWAVVAGLTYNFLPFATLPLFVSLDKIDPRYLEAAADLYARPSTAFWRVTWPLSLPGVIAATLLTFIPAAGDFVNAEFLGTPQNYMIGNVIESRFLVVLDYPTAAALSFILMLAILALVVLYLRRTGVEEVV